MKPSRMSFKSGIKSGDKPVDSMGDKTVKAYLNTLRCPVCQGQLDGTVSDQTALYCVNNSLEYKFSIDTTQSSILPLAEEVVIYHGKYRYCLKQRYSVNGDICSIYLEKVDKEGNIIMGSQPKVLSFNSKLFTFQKLNRNSLISKLKTILVFQ